MRFAWYDNRMNFKTIFCVVLFAIPLISLADSESFTRTLKLGMRGEDVRSLQIFLNADVETRVAETGVGSNGNETDYFGPATKRALIKFQEKYRAEILTPIGLVSGTGIFGAKTRAKALTLKSSSQTSAVIQASNNDVIVMFPSQYSGTPGTMITISGAGFTDDNTVYFGPAYAVVKAVSSNKQTITLKVPSVPKGTYSLYVKNSQGESNKDAFFVVTDGVTPEPKIESIGPSQAARGARVIIKGSGFTLNGNTIRGGTNIFEDISSADGASLSFVVPPSTLTATSSESGKKVFLPLWVYVVNENGVSNGKSFDLEL